MNRRGFLGLLVGGVVTVAAERAFPFRVFSFPKAVTPAFGPTWQDFDVVYYDKEALDLLKEHFKFESFLETSLVLPAPRRRLFNYKLKGGARETSLLT